MRSTTSRPATRAAAMLDEDALVTILMRHFPGARQDAVREAAEDVLLLDLLARDIGVVWEDAMRDDDASQPVNLFDGRTVRES